MTKNIYFPLHVHTDFSLLDGLSKPSQVAKRCIETGLPGSAITDHGNIAGAMSFISAMNKKSLKPIVGCEMYICEQDASIKTEENRHLYHLVVLAKNIEGWKKLVQATSESNKNENFYYKPRLSLEQLSKYVDGNLIAFSGHTGSHLSYCVFENFQEACNETHINNVKKHTYQNWIQRSEKQISDFKNIFGNENFFVEIQLIESKTMPSSVLLARGLRYVAQKTNTKTIGTPDAHYANKSDAVDQRILLCNSLNLTFKKIDECKKSGLSSFFRSDNYHIPSYEEMIAYGNTEEELENTLLLSDMCSEYDLSSDPILPRFDCPEGMSSEEYLLSLLREGWIKLYPKLKRVMEEKKIEEEVYVKRIKYEIKTLTDAGLSDYFLIVRDFILKAREEGQLTGPGRGSAAGSLALYLLGVTHVDPIEYNLLFERFYNNARNVPRHISFDEYSFLKHIGA